MQSRKDLGVRAVLIIFNMCAIFANRGVLIMMAEDLSFYFEIWLLYFKHAIATNSAIVYCTFYVYHSLSKFLSCGL